MAAASEADWAAVEALAAEAGVMAVGEIGLDFYRNLSPPDVQRDALARQLDLAARVRKPVVVHDREAHDEVTAALVAHAPLAAGGTGHPPRLLRRPAMAAALVDAGYLISFALPVSFPKNIGPRDAAAAIPATNLLVETDSPTSASRRTSATSRRPSSAPRPSSPDSATRSPSIVGRLPASRTSAWRRGVDGTLTERSARLCLDSASRAPDTLR